MTPALPRRLPMRGPVKERWSDHQARSRLAVMRRCKGQCEAPDCYEEAREWSHLFGRRAIIAEPWASSPELTAALCRPCHASIDSNRDVDLRDQLRWTAVVRLCVATNAPMEYMAGMDPLGACRGVVDWLEQRAPTGEQSE